MCFLHDANENIPEYPSVSFCSELLPNQEGATTVEQPEVIPLADDQEDKEGERGRTALKLTHQEYRVALDSRLECNHQLPSCSSHLQRGKMSISFILNLLARVE